MRKLIVVPVAVVAILVAVAAVVGWRVYSGPPAPPGQVDVGGTVENFTLPDLEGQPRALSSLIGENGAMLIFIATRCPYSNAYNERMEALARDYAARGIPVIGINPNRTEPMEEVRSHAREHGLTFTILKDDGNRLADYFGASRTPEAYLIDSSYSLLYHGRLDADSDDPSLNCNEARAAMDAVVAGKDVGNTGKKAFGCTIKRVSR
jgi:peroxiredoxin